MRKTARRSWTGILAFALCAILLSSAVSWLLEPATDRTLSANAASFKPGTPANASLQSERPGSGSRPLQIVERDEDYQVVRHPLGTTRVPRKPQRVCALDYVDELVSIGAKLAAASCSPDGRFHDYLQDRLDGVVGIRQMMGIMQPDFETLIAVRPDLIVASNPDPQTYGQLSKIAPTIVLTDGGSNSRQRLLDLGELVGRRDHAAARQAWYDAKVKAAAEVLHEKIGDRKVVFFRVFGKQYYIHGHTRGGLVLYDELGLTPPRLIATSPRGFMLSPEALLELDAEYVFVASERSQGSHRTWQELLNHPAWQRVPAVRNGHVYWLEDRHHWLVPGLLAKSRMIDEILQNIAPESLVAVNHRADSEMRLEGS